MKTIFMKPKVKKMNLKVKGLTPLITHPIDLRKEIVDALEDPELYELKKQTEEKIHRNSKGEVCFPACAFKKAMTEAAPYINIDKQKARGTFFVKAKEELVPIKFKKQGVQKSIANFGANRIYKTTLRPMFEGWSCILNIKYNANQITPEEIEQLAKIAGFQIGIGAWKPINNGTFGTFNAKLLLKGGIKNNG